MRRLTVACGLLSVELSHRNTDGSPLLFVQWIGPGCSRLNSFGGPGMYRLAAQYVGEIRREAGSLAVAQ